MCTFTVAIPSLNFIGPQSPCDYTYLRTCYVRMWLTECCAVHKQLPKAAQGACTCVLWVLFQCPHHSTAPTTHDALKHCNGSEAGCVNECTESGDYDECGDCICGMLLHGCCPVTSQQHGGACSWFYAWGAVRANLGLLVFPSCSGDEKNIFHVILFRWQPSKFDLWQCPQRCSACMYVVNLLTYISTYIHTYICSDCCLMHAVCVRTLLCRMSMGLCSWWTETSTFSLPLKTCLSSWDHCRYVGSLSCAWGTQLCMHWGKRLEACDMQAESVVLQGCSVWARWSVFHMLVCVWLITSFTVNYIFYS